MKKLIVVAVFGLALAGCGASDSRPVSVNLSTEHVTQEVKCSEGYGSYEVEGLTLKFCYPPSFGEVVTEDVAGVAGTKKHISFTGEKKGIEVWYVSNDFQPVEGETNLDVSGLDLALSEASIAPRIAELLGVAEDTIKVRKSDISAERAARVRVEGQTLSYYVPDAAEGYYMVITAPDSLAAELDDFVFDMAF